MALRERLFSNEDLRDYRALGRLIELFPFAVALVSALAASAGGRDLRTVRHLRGAFGSSAAPCAMGIACAALSSVALGMAGSALTRSMNEDGRTAVVVTTLLLSALQLARLIRLAPPQEPTRSHGALALVLLAHQVFDAPRLLVFAASAWWGTPFLAAAGGVGASAVALTIEFRMVPAFPAHRIRIPMAALVVAAALVIGLKGNIFAM